MDLSVYVQCFCIIAEVLLSRINNFRGSDNSGSSVLLKLMSSIFESILAIGV